MTVGGVSAAGVVLNANGTITVITPPGDPPGVVDVVVTDAGGTATAPGAYTYL